MTGGLNLQKIASVFIAAKKNMGMEVESVSNE